MPRQYCGHLSTQDPLHAYLRHDILPQVAVGRQPVEFRVFSMKSSKVYLYEEKYSRAQLVGKFFIDPGHSGANAIQRFFRITLPLIRPAILVAVLFRTLDAFRIFDNPFIQTHGANGTIACRGRCCAVGRRIDGPDASGSPGAD